MRLTKTTLVALFAACASACSGGGTTSLTPPPANQAVTQEDPNPTSVRNQRFSSTPTAATSATHVDGYIRSMSSDHFTISVNGGCGTDHGYLDIYTTAATKYSGGTPKLNEYAQVAGSSGSCSTSITAASVTTIVPAVYGYIRSLSTGHFTISVNAGCGTDHGYLDIYTKASTTYSGGKPKLYNYVEVLTAAGSCSTSITAASVTSNLPSVYGYVRSMSTGHFMISVNSGCGTDHGYLDIYTTPSTTYSGGTPKLYNYVEVEGAQGSCSTSITAASIALAAAPSATPLPIAQKHLLTADYLGSPYGTNSISWSSAAPYLTWAQVAPSNATAISSVGIKTQYYVDPNQTANDGDSMYTSNESTFAHTCSGNRVTLVDDGVMMYEMAIGATSLQTLFASVVNSAMRAGHYDAIWEDGAGTLEGLGITTMPCGYTDSEWLAYGRTLEDVSPLPVIVNGIEMNPTPGHVSPALALLSATNTIGGNYEDCYSYTMPKENGWVWGDVENAELQVAAENKLFECQLRDLNSASSSIDARIYALASFLLTYNPASSILWEEFPTTSGFHVLPESQLVPLYPVTSTPSTVQGLEQSGGTYARQYNECFYAGRYVGGCAVVVNPSSNYAAPFPYTQYKHTLVLSGGGILDGGTASFDGPAPASELGAEEAVIALP